MAKISCAVYYVILKIQELFAYLMGKELCKSGELVVSGSGVAKIILRNTPKAVDVVFEDDCVVVPCNPVHVDKLDFHLQKLCGHNYTLHINWEVSGLRKIKWHVKF